MDQVTEDIQKLAVLGLSGYGLYSAGKLAYEKLNRGDHDESSKKVIDEVEPEENIEDEIVQSEFIEKTFRALRSQDQMIELKKHQGEKGLASLCKCIHQNLFHKESEG